MRTEIFVSNDNTDLASNVDFKHRNTINEIRCSLKIFLGCGRVGKSAMRNKNLRLLMTNLNTVALDLFIFL